MLILQKIIIKKSFKSLKIELDQIYPLQTTIIAYFEYTLSKFVKASSTLY